MTGHEIVGYYQGDKDLCSLCRRYGKNVDFAIHHVNESMNTSLQSVTRGRRRTSGFPQTMRWFQDEPLASLSTVRTVKLIVAQFSSRRPATGPRRGVASLDKKSDNWL